MAKINSLRDIIQFNSNFKTAINLYLSLNKAEKVLGYIPTKSSVSFLGEYLKAVLENKEQATLLVGPYGKGKSHLLLVLLAVLSMKKTPESESAINELIDNVSKTDEVGERVSEYIGQVWDKKRFLPVLITDTTGDLNQAFLYGLNDALKRDGLLDLAPETYYSIALDRIDDWEQNYFETYKMFERELTQNGMSIAELKTDLKQYSQKTLILFKEIYPKVTAGSEFNPMALADALPLYKSVSEKLVDEYGYSGIYIVFDEFSKFIEAMKTMKKAMQKVEFNPFEILFVEFPEAFGTESLEETFNVIDDCKTRYDDYFRWIEEQAIKAIYDLWDKKRKQNLYHTLKEWYDKQGKRSKMGLYDGRMTNFMSCLEGMDVYSDQDVASKVVKAVTDVYMENWNTGSLEEFVEALTSVKNEVESIRDDSVSGELELKFIGRNGETIKKLYSYADENTGSILRNVIEDTLDEYDDLSVNDRVSILLEMIEKIIK